jgi:MoaA/NifB/PqqE/SkfB family radical SAM enzyme
VNFPVTPIERKVDTHSMTQFTQLIRNIRTFGRNRIPGQLVIQMTNHCNAQCPQCGMRTTADIPRSRLNRRQIERILAAAADKGVQAVSFTGGEPFLFQDDLIHCIEYAGRAGIPYIRTGTNGFIFRRWDRADFADRVKRLADKLAATRLRNFWISLDSAMPEVHEKMRGLAGVVRGIEKALPIFHAAGLFPSANLGLNRLVGGPATATLNPQAFPSSEAYLAAFYRRFQDALHRFYILIRTMGFTMVNTCYPMSISAEEHGTGLRAVYAATTVDAVVRFTDAEKAMLYQVLLDTIPEHRHHLRIFSPLSSVYTLQRYYSKEDDPSAAFGCRGGIDFFFINANDGDTYPCGYRGQENMGKFWRLDPAHLKSEGDCRRCDWECFRDPSELCAPLLQTLHRPRQLARHMSRDQLYRRLWMEDIRYYYACGFFDARRPPDPKRLHRFGRRHADKHPVRRMKWPAKPRFFSSVNTTAAAAKSPRPT